MGSSRFHPCSLCFTDWFGRGSGNSPFEVMNLINTPHKALVYDVGSSSIQFGFAGDAQPSYSVPSSAASRMKDQEQYLEFGESWLKKAFPGLEVRPIIDERGCISNSDLLAPFFDWTYQACLNIEPTEHPILITQPTHLANQPDLIGKWRKSMCEAVFDFAGHPALCLEHDAVLASYSHATCTALAVDFGWSCTRCVPIINGKPLLESMQIKAAGVSHLVRILDTTLNNNKKISYLKTPLDLQASEMHCVPMPSQVIYCRKTTFADIIRSNLSYSQAKGLPADPMLKYYFFSSRESIEIGMEVAFLGNVLFNTTTTNSPLMPIQDMIYLSIQATSTPADLRRKLWSGIATAGGLTGIVGLNEHLEKIIMPKVLKGYSAKVLPPLHNVTSGPFTVWAGGSILASLDNFPDLCITKAEWDEVGSNILNS